jgi:hypothetical protein
MHALTHSSSRNSGSHSHFFKTRREREKEVHSAIGFVKVAQAQRPLQQEGGWQTVVVMSGGPFAALIGLSPILPAGLFHLARSCNPYPSKRPITVRFEL